MKHKDLERKWNPYMGNVFDNTEIKKIKMCKSSASGKTTIDDVRNTLEESDVKMIDGMRNIDIEKFIIKNTLPIIAVTL